MSFDVLIISTQPPYHSSHAVDAIEAALAASNVGLKVGFILQGDGVYQLLDQQNPQAISHKNVSKQLKVLPLYDIDDIFIESTNTELTELRVINDAPPCSQISTNDVTKLIHAARHVLVF